MGKGITKLKKISNGLWSKDFTILMAGSFISIAGSAIVDIIFGLAIVDITGSGIFYSVMLALANIAGVLVPIIVGPSLEVWKKRKVIYTLDFISAGVFFCLALLCRISTLSKETILIGSLIFETVNIIYGIAFESFIPEVVKKENYTKAYSIDSVLSNIAEASVFIGIIVYELIGIESTLFISGIFFLAAAICETQIKTERPVTVKKESGGLFESLRGYADLWKRIKDYKGFKEILVIDAFDALRTGALWAIVLPFFELIYPYENIMGIHLDRDYIYIIIMMFYGMGQCLGGIMNYSMDINKGNRMNIFLIATICEVGALAVFPFFGPIPAGILMFIAGVSSVFTFCSYESVMFEKMTDDTRGKFAGLLASISAAFLVIGNLAGGWFIDCTSIPEWGILITSVPQIISMAVAFIFMFPRVKYYFESDKTVTEK